MEENKPCLLVVDDEMGMREGIRRIFTMEGYDVTVAENGSEGIARGSEHEYDVALIDLKMPDIDGLTVLRTLKDKFPDTEYMMITAFAGIDTAVEATRHGAYTYVPKPFTPDQIVFEVNRALGKRRLTLETRELRAEQERRMLEISQEKSRLRTVINAINDAVFVTNLEDEIVLANPQTRSLFKFPSTIKAGDKISDILPVEVIELIREAQEKTRDGIELVSHEWEMKPGLELVVNMKTAPVKDAEGNILGFVSTIQDVTQLKRLDAQKSQFVSMVAHELKAPVAAVSGYLETMHSRVLGDDISVYEKMIARSKERLQALIDLVNDLLNISRRDLGTIRREIVAVDVPDIVENTRELLQGEIDSRGLSFETEYEAGLPAIDVDRDEFTRVVTNLLSNAIKYNREQGRIIVRAQTDNDSLLLSVSDTGIGMKEQDQEMLFRQFYRIKNDETRAIPGTGLGLSIVRQIIDSYHGNIEVESVWQRGTTFTIRIPIRFSPIRFSPDT
ncbi:MAG: response regulator [Bacteroidetes bacterium]|nr:response regulator [Bacteroidota bacterium]